MADQQDRPDEKPDAAPSAVDRGSARAPAPIRPRPPKSPPAKKAPAKAAKKAPAKAAKKAPAKAAKKAAPAKKAPAKKAAKKAPAKPKPTAAPQLADTNGARPTLRPRQRDCGAREIHRRRGRQPGHRPGAVRLPDPSCRGCRWSLRSPPVCWPSCWSWLRAAVPTTSDDSGLTLTRREGR